MSQIPGKVLKTVLVCVFILTGINGCKDNYTSIIPYVSVDMDINPTSYIEFNIPGGSYYFKDVGYAGIIIFRDLNDNETTFFAYDAACTYDYKVSGARQTVVADGSGIATCPQCGSQFILFGGAGTPVKGPATEPLKQYRTSYIGGRIIVRN
jgi:nitrite reductase/ring-hydroxylating ferredoxin subunit